MNSSSLSLACAAILALTLPATAAPPLGYLRGFGPKSDPVVQLTWGLLALSTLVVVVVTALVVIGTLLRRARGGGGIARAPVERGGSGLRWISVGLGISCVALLLSLVWTMVVLAAVNAPPRPARVTIEITAQQWWFKARYLSPDPSRVFTTADEIHIPVGEPVRIRLIGADVIHSFWVPALSGKMDAIPGQINETWIEADHTGRYGGECSEYCGVQHAHMGLVVVADPAAQFQQWWDGQLRPANSPQSAQTVAGERDFEFHCGACHSARGTAAGGTVAPDLTHLMSRGTLAGGMLANNIGNLAGWLANPQSLKPGTNMPNLYLSGQEIASVTAYLQTLQ